MDVLQRSGVPCTPGHSVDDRTSRSQSPDYFSSDSVSQYSFDSSASSQDSVASSASSVSTSWKDALDQQRADADDRQDKVREYVSSVSQVAHTWAHGSNGSQPPANAVDAGRVPTGAPLGVNGSARPCSSFGGPSHRKTLSCLTDVRPTKLPCEGVATQSSSQGSQLNGQQLFTEPQKPHPRRSCATTGFVKPTLRRDHERHEINVEHLVDSSASLVAAIWPAALQQNGKSTEQCSPILSLRSFVRETLKRSRTSHSTLQVTLYYLTLIHTRALCLRKGAQAPQKLDDHFFGSLQCGRRMFLAALILASKYLQDANYSAKAWSKITGLAVPEITKNEIAFLKAIDYTLHVKESDYRDWAEVVKRCTAGPCFGMPQVQGWLNVLKMLRFGCPLPVINKGLLALGPTSRATGQPSSLSPTATHARRSSLSIETSLHEPVECISPQLLTKVQSSPPNAHELPLNTPSATPSRPATAIPPTPLLSKSLATPPGISPWSASRASYTPAASSIGSALSSAQSTPAARLMTPRANSPCYERVVQHLQRMKALEKPMGACQISSQPVAGAPPSPQLTIASSSDDETENLEHSQLPRSPRTVVSHGLPSPVQSSIASSSDDEDGMFAEVRVPETPAQVVERLPASDKACRGRPTSLQRCHTVSDMGPGSSSLPHSNSVFENVRTLLSCERSSHCAMATPRLTQTSLSATKTLNRKRGSNDIAEGSAASHKLRRITSSSN